MRVGFIGVGNLGHPMAGHLLKAGHDLVVHDLRQGAAAPWNLASLDFRNALLITYCAFFTANAVLPLDAPEDRS